MFPRCEAPDCDRLTGDGERTCSVACARALKQYNAAAEENGQAMDQRSRYQRGYEFERDNARRYR